MGAAWPDDHIRLVELMAALSLATDPGLGQPLEKRAVDTVLEAAGAAPLRVRQGYPAGLTDREVEALRHLVKPGRTRRLRRRS